MSYTRAERTAADVYEACDIRRLPIDCNAILSHYGLRAMNIKELKDRHPELYALCLNFSEDSFLYRKGKLIVYRDINYSRTRFSLMHELGHYLLGHRFGSPEEEWEANHFAAYILAPRPCIPYCGSSNVRVISFYFSISLRAAEIVKENYYKWWCTHQALTEQEEQLLIRLYGRDYLTTQARRTRSFDDWVQFRYLHSQEKQRLFHEEFSTYPDFNRFRV